MTDLEIYDTTLRDGSQQEGISLTVGDKLRIASLLDELGVAYVEGGWPGALPKDDEFFARARKDIEFRHATLVAFGSTRRPGARASSDPQLQALLEAETTAICIVGKTWDYHVREALRTDLDEGLRMISESVAYLRTTATDGSSSTPSISSTVIRANPDYALKALAAAHEAGAERLVLCDTNGGTLPDEISNVIGPCATCSCPEPSSVSTSTMTAGCAVASSLAAVKAGVRQIQGCVNGYGERTGNADLCTIIPDLVLKMGIAGP